MGHHRLRLLLDTNVMIWVAGEPRKLSKTAQAALVDPRNEILISASSVWEIAIKHHKRGFAGSAALAHDFERAWSVWSYTPLPITFRHAQLAPALPGEHKDPFDRMVAAQAILESARLVSSDDKMDQFGVQRLW